VTGFVPALRANRRLRSAASGPATLAETANLIPAPSQQPGLNAGLPQTSASQPIISARLPLGVEMPCGTAGIWAGPGSVPARTLVSWNVPLTPGTDCKSVGLHLRRRLVRPKGHGHAQCTAARPSAFRSCRSCTPSNLTLLLWLAQDCPHPAMKTIPNRRQSQRGDGDGRNSASHLLSYGQSPTCRRGKTGGRAAHDRVI